MGDRFIEKLAGLAHLGPDEIEALVGATASQRDHPARHDLIREGDQAGKVIVILEGWACRSKILPKGDRQILAYLMPGDSCDLHGGLLPWMDHSLQTVTRARVATIEQADMMALMEKYRGIADAMYRNQMVDAAMSRAWIAAMGRHSSKESVAHLLCEIYLRCRSVGLSLEAPYLLPLSQTLLADSVGISPVHMNRVMGRLRDSGAISMQRGGLVIENPAMLAGIAGFDECYLSRRSRPQVEQGDPSPCTDTDAVP